MRGARIGTGRRVQDGGVNLVAGGLPDCIRYALLRSPAVTFELPDMIGVLELRAIRPSHAIGVGRGGSRKQQRSQKDRGKEYRQKLALNAHSLLLLGRGFGLSGTIGAGRYLDRGKESIGFGLQ